MGRKLSGYFLIYLSSFCFFTGIFHAVANASIGAELNANNQELIVEDEISPTPTIFFAPTQMPTPTFILPTSTPIPSLTPSTLPSIAVTSDLESMFAKYGAEYGVDKEFLKKIAKCESGFNPEADAGLYKGMFQFAEQTWVSTRASMGMDTNADLRKNAEESIRTAAYKVANGGQNAWLNCI